MAQDHTRPDTTTRDADARASRGGHDADRMPTPEEEKAAEGNLLDKDARENIEEAYERGAAQKGEGRISG